jgi:hypothetical protein
MKEMKKEAETEEFFIENAILRKLGGGGTIKNELKKRSKHSKFWV